MSAGAERFLLTAVRAAQAASHPFPAVAACEAALESGWGLSTLATKANNFFGEKAPFGWLKIDTIELPTHEFLNKKWVRVMARWKFYRTPADCFADRVATLKLEAPRYPHYAAALAANTPEQYIEEVSKTWATDPSRAKSVMAIYAQYAAVLKPYL